MPYDESAYQNEDDNNPIIHKAGEWYEDGKGGKFNPTHDIKLNTVEINKTQYEEKERFSESQSKEINRLRNELESKPEKQKEPEQEDKTYLNLLVDIHRLDKIIKRLEKRQRKTPSDDISVKCANSIGFLEVV